MKEKADALAKEIAGGSRPTNPDSPSTHGDAEEGTVAMLIRGELDDPADTDAVAYWPRLPSGLIELARCGLRLTIRSRAPRASSSCAAWRPK